jgi:hypothetical protein
MKFVNNLDLNKNELQNARVQNLAAAPSSPVTGQVYYDTAVNKLYVWDGSAWKDLTGATAPQLTGDVTTDGSSNATSIASGVIVNADINASAAIALSKLATDPLARANHTGSQTASTISDLSTVVQGYRLDQFAAPTSALNANSQRITSVADPQNAQDAATKNYVDATKTGLAFKDPVRVATTANITLSGTQTIDGIAVIAGDRVLVKDQTTASQNGIYVVSASSWSRAVDADNSPSGEVEAGLYTYVEQGTSNGSAAFVLSTANPITLGTTALTFTKFSGTGQLTAGTGISISGNSISVASTYAGGSSIATLGTVTTGTWSATNIGLNKGGTNAALTAANGGIVYSTASAMAITAAGTSGQALLSGGAGAPTWGTLAVAAGGTGATTAAAARTNLGAVGKYSVDVGNGSATAITVTHNLNTLDVQVFVYTKSDGSQVIPDVTVSTVNAVIVTFATAPTTNQYRVVVVG